ncbi:unnamed protein product [Lampetra planeri]
MTRTSPGVTERRANSSSSNGERESAQAETRRAREQQEQSGGHAQPRENFWPLFVSSHTTQANDTTPGSKN